MVVIAVMPIAPTSAGGTTIGERSSPEAVAAHRRTEKRLTQARRAVEKAAHVLRRADAYTPVEDGD